MAKLLFSFLVLMTLTFPAANSGAAETPFTHLVLRDVQTLFGGRNIYVNSKGGVWIQVIGRSGEETRTFFTIAPDKLTELQKLLLASHNLNFAIPKNPNKPQTDNSFPELIVKLNTQEVHRVRKQISQPHPLFDPIYNYLINLTPASSSKNQILYQGSYLQKWFPAGFEGL